MDNLKLIVEGIAHAVKEYTKEKLNIKVVVEINYLTYAYLLRVPGTIPVSISVVDSRCVLSCCSGHVLQRGILKLEDPELIPKITEYFLECVKHAGCTYCKFNGYTKHE